MLYLLDFQYPSNHNAQREPYWKARFGAAEVSDYYVMRCRTWRGEVYFNSFLNADARYYFANKFDIDSAAEFAV